MKENFIFQIKNLIIYYIRFDKSYIVYESFLYKFDSYNESF